MECINNAEKKTDKEEERDEYMKFYFITVQKSPSSPSRFCSNCCFLFLFLLILLILNLLCVLCIC